MFDFFVIMFCLQIINWMQNRLSTAKQDKRRTEAAAVASSARSKFYFVLIWTFELL
jgi:hypothetical protein